MPRPGGCATPGTLRLLVRSPTLSVCPSPGRCAPLLPSRSQGLPAPRFPSPLRPLSPTLLPLLSPPPLWLLSAMALASLVQALLVLALAMVLALVLAFTRHSVNVLYPLLRLIFCLNKFFL